MNSISSILIMTSNYSHDIATAFLAVSGATLWILSRSYPESSGSGMGLYFVRVYQGVIRVAKFSLAWILIAGVPRVIFYRQFEWSNMAGDLQVVAIIIKHIVMFFLVGTGLFYWHKLDKRVRNLKIKYSTS
jgi:hypothetical protein